MMNKHQVWEKIVAPYVSSTKLIIEAYNLRSARSEGCNLVKEKCWSKQNNKAKLYQYFNNGKNLAISTGTINKSTKNIVDLENK